ncbi:peroxiredoxin [soil metagenome]|jgi:peroxiredoxin
MTSEHLPDDLPVPVDDGATDHLVGTTVPPVGLTATTGEVLSLDRVSGRTVLFVYPRTGISGQPSPTGWDAIPGARGCTPQNCAIRDAYEHFTALGARVFGLSSQSTADQLEAAQRLHLPYPLLSDSDLTLATAWQLPTFSVDGLTLIRRITIFLMNGAVDGVIYPVFPPDGSAETALSWLRARLVSGSSGRAKIWPRRGLPHPIPRPPVR